MGREERANDIPTIPNVIFDIEVLYANGAVDVFTVHGGRDSMRADKNGIRLEIRPSPEIVEEIIIHRQHVARLKTTQRTLAEEPRVVRQ